MGHFYYSSAYSSGIPIVGKEVERISEELWPGRYRVERHKEVPVTSGDDRKATWMFWDTRPEWNSTDCAFTISLLKKDRLEFKVPRTQWDSCWEDQQSIRRRLVSSLRKAKSP
ncbi:MAG: hypothetical protein BWY99_01809 [Synergistetes bacterium ADurb.BinA166]|nr:MAG: hypothetical protein BWY99_01809 [Synergistetes bacterium ADurb.BinA166]